MSNRIEIGMCLPPEKVAELAPGYDYVELPIMSALNPLEDDATVAPRLAAYKVFKPPVRSANLFAPPEFKFVGPNADWAAVETYISRMTQRVAAVGGKVAVFGAGQSRAVPEGTSRAMVWGQMVRVLNLCADYGAQYGVTICIEPLNRKETNLINTYLEGVQLARDVDRSEVRVLADIFHFMMDGEDVDDIAKEPDYLAHVHLADTLRLYPGSGSYPLERLFAILGDIGYQGGASVECKWGADYTGETAKALSFLRGLTERYGQ